MPTKDFFHRASSKGFTLIELMVVIVILGILATIIVPKIMDRPGQARQLKARMQLESFETALKLYKLDNGAYPTTEQGLQALVVQPAGESSGKNYPKEGYLEKGSVPKDPWGRDYIYLCPGVNSAYDIVSYGADGVQGGDGENKDVTSWETNE